MRKFINTFLLFLIANLAQAQAPQGIPYQAAARNSSGAILASTAISVRFTIRDSVATGAIKYRETFSVTTTAQGMFSVNVGQGTVVSGSFAGINWGTNAKFMQVEMDPAGGASYIDMGTTQLMSVPYALNTASFKFRVSAIGDTVYSGNGSFVIIPGSSAANTPLTIGMSYGGGKIAYILVPGDPGYITGETHGLIAAPSDQSTSIQWYNGSYITTGATGTALGTGMSNTNAIVAAQGAGSYAAKLCADLVLNGYGDWYLPSINELHKLYSNRSSIGEFTTDSYWSSSELSSSEGVANLALAIFFGTGATYGDSKHVANRVRAVRSF
jgi:hypothetical protein